LLPFAIVNSAAFRIFTLRCLRRREQTMATRAKKSRSSRSRDRKLVAGRQKHEVRYAAKKAGVKSKAVKKAVKRVGHSRGKVERVLSGVRKAVKRVAQAPKKVVQALSPTPETKSDTT
jgi:hypothetical protein